MLLIASLLSFRLDLNASSAHAEGVAMEAGVAPT